jgi:hypothetical protein
MWIFNKKNGPKVVSAGATEQWDGAPRPVLEMVGEPPVPQATPIVRPGRPLPQQS